MKNNWKIAKLMEPYGYGKGLNGDMQPAIIVISCICPLILEVEICSRSLEPIAKMTYVFCLWK